MKISYIILSLAGGGAERVLSLIAEESLKRGHQVTIYTCLPFCEYSIPAGIKMESAFNEKEITPHFLSKLRRKSLFIFRLHAYLKANKPDVVISFMAGINKQSIIASKLLNLPIIVSEHSNYQKMNFIEWFERRWIYKMADSVTVLTKFDFDNYYNKFLTNVEIMPNPVSFSSINEVSNKEESIIVVGSLDRWEIKGFDNLLKVFAKVVELHPNWVLKIAGSGTQGMNYLKQLSIHLGIEDNVHFLGFCISVDKELKKSSIFVLSSRYEGFPMALLEAMSQGCACISFDCVSGPAEIITNGVDGILVEDQNLKKLEQAICDTIENEDKRIYLASNAIKNIQRFSLEYIGVKWDTVINAVVSVK